MFPIDFVLYLQIIIILFITPGTPRIVIVSYAMNYGVPKCIWSAFGDIIANLIQSALVIFVIGSFFLDNFFFLNLIKWIGIIYLIYLALDIYKSQLKDFPSDKIKKKTKFSFFKDGFLVAATSPKAWMFFLFIFPQFIDFNSNYIIQFFILISTYIVLDFFSLIIYALLAESFIKRINTNPKIINTISASVLIVIALIVAIT
tara:strand:+ start:48 stop:653 length:606 start_codon:yes stop_codon:yes gene_type:complete